MIGVSEYSTAHLTQDGKQLIENAILYQLGIQMPTPPEDTEQIITEPSPVIRKVLRDGVLYILRGDQEYTILGHF
jgi:hypothetical protein